MGKCVLSKLNLNKSKPHVSELKNMRFNSWYISTSVSLELIQIKKKTIILVIWSTGGLNIYSQLSHACYGI